MGELSFVDTTLRDGQMSLWATNMTTTMMLPIAEKIDQAGFQAAELLAAAFFKKLVRELRDDPWERIRLIHARMPNTPLRAIRGRYMSAFQITPASIMQLWLERLAANGIREVRISDSSNTVAIWREQIRSAQTIGLTAIVNLIFSISPKHTDDYYAHRAAALAGFGAERICIKDPGGLLTPERMRTLVPAVLREAGSVPVELHTHCNVGMGTPSCVEAIKLGIRLVDTAVPPLSDASSNPSVFDILANAQALGYSTSLDERPLADVERYLTALARRERLPMGAPARYDSFHYLHQVPGGMISNLRHQLSALRMDGKLRAVLEEAARVRAELGYPIMVTPYSQFVGAQAMMNVAQGERYKVVSDELIQYALGFWGEEESASIQPDVRQRILESPRAKQLSASRPVELSLAELRRQYGGGGVSDEELLLRYFSSESDIAAMRAAPSSLASKATGTPVFHFIVQMMERGGFGYLKLQKGAESLTLRRGS